jgi:hypothetical protein
MNGHTDPRITRLEDDSRILQRDVSDVKAGVSNIKGQLPYLATKAQMHLYGTGTIGGIVLLVLRLFGVIGGQSAV